MNKTGKILIYSGITLLVISFLLAVYFKWEDWYSLKASHSVMEKMISKEKKEDVYEDNGFKVIKIEEIEYIGYIEIPSLGLNLPVTNGYSYATLKKTPALYYGNIDSNFVICGHSYKAHFGNLYKLKPGDKVNFIDVLGNKYTYEVEETEELKPTEIKEMIESEFDLTLYTCTKDSMNRVTVRCNRI